MASLTPNGILPVACFLAAARLGAVSVGINTRYRSADLRHVLERARPVVLLAVPSLGGIDFHPVVAAALKGLPGPSPVVVWSDELPGLLSRQGPIERDAAVPSDMAVAFTTSGTTGRPKLAAHDHATTVRHLRAVARAMDVSPDTTGLIAVPFCGTFGFVSLMSVLDGGGRVVVPERFVPAEAAALIDRHRVTHLNGSDDMLLAVLDRIRLPGTWRHGVHAEFSGQGEKVVARAEAAGVRLTGVYGSSETFAVLARRPPIGATAERARNGGIPVDPATEARVVDTVTGAACAAGEPGELQLKGPSLLGGYLVDDGVVPPEIEAGGWFATGDLAHVDTDGGFTYLARLGDALRLAGFLTDPSEIEQHLTTHPGVHAAQVVGAVKPGGGDAAIAFVVVDDDTDEATLLAHCRDGLANYKVPARIIALDGFPLIEGANGVKIRKNELREQAARLLS